MDGMPDRFSEITVLYARWLAAPFPARMRGRDVAGVDMVSLDADVAGCVRVWLDNGGVLDDRRWACLGRRLDELDRTVPLLTGDPESAYYIACRTVAALVWETEPTDRASV